VRGSSRKSFRLGRLTSTVTSIHSHGHTLEQRVDHLENVGPAREICNTYAHRLTKDRTLKNHDLYHLLHRYQDSMCSDPRDRVFSLCGLSSAYVEFVDYTKSPEELLVLTTTSPSYGTVFGWHKLFEKRWTCQPGTLGREKVSLPQNLILY